MEIIDFKEEKMSALVEMKGVVKKFPGVTAVSYTHLDVYKRQTRYSLWTVTKRNASIMTTELWQWLRQ